MSVIKIRSRGRSSSRWLRVTAGVRDRGRCFAALGRIRV